MTKQPLDIEKLFEQEFDDFSPKASENFHVKMAKRLGLASIFGFSITTFLSKTINSLKAIPLQTVSLFKAMGIVKTLVITAVISTSLTTIVLVNSAEKTDETNNNNQNIISKGLISDVNLSESEIKTAFSNKEKLDDKINTSDQIQESKTRIREESINGENHSKNDLTSGKSSHNPSILNEQNKSKKKNTESIDFDSPKNIKPFKERGIIQALEKKSTPTNVYDPNLILQKSNLNLTVNIDEDPLKGKFLSKYHLSGELHLMPFLYDNLSPFEPLINDTIIIQEVSENPELSYQLGFSFRLQKKKNPWFINIGVNYQRLSEKIDYHFKREYHDEALNYWNTDSVFYYYINSPQIDTLFSHMDSAYIEHWSIEDDSQIYHNSYQLINIPLIFGYEFLRPRKKISLQVSMGIEMAIHLNSSGYLYTNSGHIKNYHDIETHTKLNWYYLASFGINYQLKKTSLFILPSVKYQLNTGKINNYPKEHKYFIYGLKFGIRFKLF
ncbi:MAG: hypothetical protein GQ527_06445 [Bacteroidales bacterium]|nr:hypothetical protein [Bacteroidales bacterium]